ncbi:YndM family protein [Oceanobacillus sp. 1P07AA]|uniref:YndM family protein n=1 Tax=Oceanobacillus sp. 1P07AA TaxID=3132293 RepID=UPI0039A42FD8
MRYIAALFLKFLITLFTLWIVLGFIYGNSFGSIFVLSMIVTTITYIGDLFILPRLSSQAAVIADFILYWAVLWFASITIVNEMNSIGIATLISTIAISLIEIYFHQYMLDDVIHQKKMGEIAYFPTHRFQTETSEEITPSKNDDDSKKE